MKNIGIAFVALSSLVSNIVAVAAQQCSLTEFDTKGPPPSVRDVSPPTNNSKFEWGSDVDPWNGQARGWHYIKNLHSKRLSLSWEKPALVIPFDSPLDPGGTFCKYDYGAIANYKLDSNAPISVSNDGVKAAEAYVQAPGQRNAADGPATTGAELRRTYQGSAGAIQNAFAKIILKYFSADKVLEVDLSSGPGETRIGFGPEMIGVSQEAFFEKLKTSELNFKGPVVLGQLFRPAELDSISVNPRQRVALLRAGEERSLKFENVSAVPSGVAPMILIAPDGAPLGLTTVKLDLLSER